MPPFVMQKKKIGTCKNDELSWVMTINRDYRSTILSTAGATDTVKVEFCFGYF